MWGNRRQDRRPGRRAFRVDVSDPRALESRQLLSLAGLTPDPVSGTVGAPLSSAASVPVEVRAADLATGLGARPGMGPAGLSDEIRAAANMRDAQRLPLPPGYDARNRARRVEVDAIRQAFTNSVRAQFPRSVASQRRGFGKAAQVTAGDRQNFMIAVLGPGVVRVRADSFGRVAVFVDGTTEYSELVIEPLNPKQPPDQGTRFRAHDFSWGQTKQDSLIEISDITISSGKIGAISGFRTAILSGKVTAQASTPVDRIAFYAIKPGASITTGGDLNTLDVLRDVELGAGDQILIGRDLNLMNVGEDLKLGNGASFVVGRSIGTLPQPAKGSSTGANVLSVNTLDRVAGDAPAAPLIGAYIKGSLLVDDQSSFYIGRGSDSDTLPMAVEGDFAGFDRFKVVRTQSRINNFINSFSPNGLLISSQLFDPFQPVNAVLEPFLDIIVRGNVKDFETLPRPPIL